MDKEAIAKIEEMSATVKELLCRSERDKKLLDALLINVYQQGKIDEMERMLNEFDKSIN